MEIIEEIIEKVNVRDSMMLINKTETKKIPLIMSVIVITYFAFSQKQLEKMKKKVEKSFEDKVKELYEI